MAKTGLYQLYDTKAESVAGPIQTHRKEGSAVRAFHGVLEAAETMPNRYPEDFELRQVGEQDEETGEITPGLKTITTGTVWKAGQPGEES